MLKIDFGSGYNPNREYKTCDITYSPTLDYVYDIKKQTILGLEENAVDEFYLRNVVHHIKELEMTFLVLKRYLKKGGILHIIEANKEHFTQNVILDIFWYRWLIPRQEIWFSQYYRDYKKILQKIGFMKKAEMQKEEKEESIWIK